MEPQQTNVPEAIAPVVTVTLPTFGQLWSRTWEFIGGHFWRLAGIVILSFLVTAVGYSLTALLHYGAAVDWALPQLYLIAVLSSILMLTTAAFAQLLLILGVAYDHELSLGDLIRRSRMLFLPYIATLFLTYAAVIGGFALIIIPGLIMSFLVAPVFWVVAKEGLSYRAALDRSIALVEGRLAYVVGKFLLVIILCILSLLTFVLAAMVIAPLSFLVIMMHETFGFVLAGVLGVTVYVGYFGIVTIFMLRFLYEIYIALVGTYVEHPASRWRGMLLTVMLAIGSVIGVLYLLSTPFTAVEQATKPMEWGDFGEHSPESDRVEQEIPESLRDIWDTDEVVDLPPLEAI
jgi:hypothetical protein